VVDFVTHKKKRPLADFRNHPSLRKFDQVFEESKYRNLLHKLGIREKNAEIVMKNHFNELRVFRRAYTYFERAKSQRGTYKVADGITRDAVFCMRDILRELPQMLLTRGDIISPEEFTEIIQSSYAKKADLRLTSMRLHQISRFQTSYLKIMDLLAKSLKKERSQVLLDVTMRSSVINKYDRVTGDSITHVVDKVARCRPKLRADEVYHLMKGFSHYQNLDPDLVESEDGSTGDSSRQRNILRGMADIVRDCREGL